MFRMLAASMAVVAANAWDMPKVFDGHIEPATWNSYLGDDALNGVTKIIGELNLGAMTAMQSDPNNISTTCYEKADGTSVLIKKLLDSSDKDDESSIVDKFNVIQVKLIEELEACQLTQLQFLFDGILSSIPELSGMGGNLLT